MLALLQSVNSKTVKIASKITMVLTGNPVRKTDSAWITTCHATGNDPKRSFPFQILKFPSVKTSSDVYIGNNGLILSTVENAGADSI
jgi:hypothetical protein